MSQQPDGSTRCPTCGQCVLPHQSRCPDCNTRLTEAPPAEESAPAPEAAGILPAQAPKGDTCAIVDPPSPGGRHCPGCGAALGEQAVLCVQCGYDFRLGKARATVVEHLKSETPQERRRRQVASFPQVLRGLILHAARILLRLLATVLIIGLTFYAASLEGVPTPGQRTFLEVGLLGGVGVGLLSEILGFAGSVLCLRLPDSLARGLLVVNMVLGLAILPVGIVASILNWSPLLSWAMGLGSWVLFLVFLVRLARCIDRPSEAREARNILLFGLFLDALPITLIMMASRFPDLLLTSGMLLICLLPIFAVLYFCLYFWVQVVLLLRLLETLRGSLRQQIDEAPK
jgi:hypothetical protein